ncbi:hypothetical protein NKL07_26420 [Mesorhizobium sp. C280B]|uniref:hypothetical protein n=1 Tax=unclassified Mesorhizobium TaxID=325217 RepID=UPI0003CF4B18|nr:hypothetical protein [Mesorhizobium sp. LSJC280B00]ESW86446.1 hypothetical protein X772_13060 [Mesorhizobium sp. LSJC280B00]
MDMNGTFERIFSVTSVWTSIATIPISLAWGESAWMVVFIFAILAASFAFPRRLAELLNRFEHPIGYLERNFKNDWTGWSHTKSNINMIYNLGMIQKYHYVLLLITVIHFLISGALGESELAVAYLAIMAAFSLISVAFIARHKRKR